MAGALLMAIYSRSRWNDLQHTSEMLVDTGTDGNIAYLECKIYECKTRGAAAFRGQYLPAVAPAMA